MAPRTQRSLSLSADDTAVSAGIETTKLVPSLPIFQQCAFLGDALKNGGKDYDQPLWNLSVLSAVFMENGNDLAHQFSKGHTTYRHDETQALYDRKVADRRDRNVQYQAARPSRGPAARRAQPARSSRRENHRSTSDRSLLLQAHLVVRLVKRTVNRPHLSGRTAATGRAHQFEVTQTPSPQFGN